MTLRGPDAGLYYVEAVGDYYLDRSEPEGLWHGRGAERLGLSGELDDEAFLALMDGHHPESGRPLGRRYGDASVRGFDVTASAPKSVSVLFALGDDRTRRAVLVAHDRAVAAMVGWIEDHAHTRFRVVGEVMTFDAQGIVAASFRQHTSRALDPQLHTHVVIANRVLSPDGRWLALDARTLKVDQRALSAIYHAGLRAELTRSLGVAWYEPANGIAEVADVPQEVLEEFSSRTRDVQERIEAKLERFAESFERPPTPRERWQLEREAVEDSRPSKSHGIDARSLHAEWAQRSTAMGHEPELVVADAVGRAVGERSLDTQAVAERALDALADKQSAWRTAELVRELAAAVPTDHAVGAAELVASLDRLAEEVAEAELVDLSPPVPSEMPLRRDGRPITESALDRQLTTPAILAQEVGLVNWAQRRLQRGGQDAVLEPFRAEALSGPQREVAAAVAGERELVLVVGPAGTGKTTALAPAVEQLSEEGRRVFGVAPSAAAAEVLRVEAGVPADTLDKLLVEHRLSRQPGPGYALPPGTTVIVDEAAMVSTGQLFELAALAERNRWRVALVGDPLQFSGVGRAGMFAHLVGCSAAIELETVRRFVHPWEREASLSLRRGDPEVLDLYQRKGRLHEGTRGQIEQAVVEAWWAARQGGEQALMLAATNEAADRLNQRAQQVRLEAGELDPAMASLWNGRHRILPGDEVATRQNDRRLLTDRGLMVKNRDRWAMDGVHGDGSVTVSGRSGTVILPPEYARQHLELAYAQTAHASQGRTVDRSLLLVDGPTDSRGVYVPMTRGRLTNEAFVVVEGEERAADVLARALVSDWADRPAIARRPPGRHPLLLDGPELRDLFQRRHDLAKELSHIRWALSSSRTQRRNAERERARLQQDIEAAQQRITAAREGGNTQSSVLHPRRRADERARAAACLRDQETAIERDTAALADVGERLTKLDRLPVTEQDERRVRQELHEIDGRLDQDRRLRAQILAPNPSPEVFDVIGDRPAEHGERSYRWDVAAGSIDQHRVAFGLDAGAPATAANQWPDSSAALAECERELADAIEAVNPPAVGRLFLERGIDLGIDR